MAGVGRRTLYRKSVTEEYLNSTAEPSENEAITLVQAPRGSNIIEIKLATGEQALAILPTRFRKLIWVKRGDYLITSTSAGDFETCAGETGKVRHRVEHILNKDHIKHLKNRGLWPTAFSGTVPAARCGPETSRVDCRDEARASGNRQEGDAPTGLDHDHTDITARAAAGVNAVDAAVGVRRVVQSAGASVEESRKAPGDASKEEGEEEHAEEDDDEDDMSDLFVNNNRAAMMRLRMNHSDEEEEDSELDSEDEDN